MTTPTAMDVQQDVTNAVIKLLQVTVKRPVGDHRSPPGGGFPYLVVYSIEGGGLSGPPFSAPDIDADLVYQVTAVGQRRDQAQWLADRARRALLGRNQLGRFTSVLELPAGWTCCSRLLLGPAPGVIVEGDTPHEIYSAPARFQLSITPV